MKKLIIFVFLIITSLISKGDRTLMTKEERREDRRMKLEEASEKRREYRNHFEEMKKLTYTDPYDYEGYRIAEQGWIAGKRYKISSIISSRTRLEDEIIDGDFGADRETEVAIRKEKIKELDREIEKLKNEILDHEENIVLLDEGIEKEKHLRKPIMGKVYFDLRSKWEFLD